MFKKIIYKNKCVSFCYTNNNGNISFGFQDIIVNRFIKINLQEIINILKNKFNCDDLVILNIFDI